MQPVVEARNLERRYGKSHALHPTSLNVPPGSVLALLGHNGAGKTTLLKLLMNLLRPSGGAATVFGEPTTQLGGDSFQRIGYVSENQELPGWMTVGDFLRYQSGFYPHWDDAALIQRFQLPLKRKLKHLSRGQRMKAALASILAFRPALIVLDEPLSGLDPLVRDELIEALLAATADPTHPTTVLLSSHDLAEIESFATHIAFVHAGRLLFTEPLPNLFNRFRQVTLTIPPASFRRNYATLMGPTNPGGPSFPVSSERVGSSTAPTGDLTIPPTWTNLRRTADSLRFVHTHADTAPIQDEVGSLFPMASSTTVDPMTLRSIFLAIVKAQDAKAEDGARS